MKSILPSAAGETGIFNVHNEVYQGFQQGAPEKNSRSILIDLYSTDDGFEIVFLPGEHQSHLDITQPEINQVVQTLRRSAPSQAMIPIAAKD